MHQTGLSALVQSGRRPNPPGLGASDQGIGPGFDNYADQNFHRRQARSVALALIFGVKLARS
jgi:hypothetical protein